MRIFVLKFAPGYECIARNALRTLENTALGLTTGSYISWTIQPANAVQNPEAILEDLKRAGYISNFHEDKPCKAIFN